MRSYSEVDEVLEEEKIDDEIEEYVIQERLAREKKWKNLLSVLNLKRRNDLTKNYLASNKNFCFFPSKLALGVFSFDCQIANDWLEI